MLQTEVNFVKQTILLYSAQEKTKSIEVQAEVIGDYAVHESIDQRNSVTLTHVPTGFAVWDFWMIGTAACVQPSMESLTQQVKAAAVLCSRLPSFTQEDLVAPKPTKAVESLMEIVRRAKAEQLY